MLTNITNGDIIINVGRVPIELYARGVILEKQNDDEPRSDQF